MSVKILFLAGSARQDSANKKLAKAACKLAKEMGAVTTFVDLKNFSMPIYDGDLEVASSLPEKAIELKEVFIEHQGLFIASPEYNSSFSPILKNALDWISRPHTENELALSAYAGKVVALTAASPGGFGGLRGLVPLRMMFGNIATTVIPEQLALTNAFEAFDETGELVHEQQLQGLKKVVESLIEKTNKLHCLNKKII